MYWMVMGGFVVMALFGFGAASAGMPFSEFVQSILCGVVVGALVSRHL
tara:strand:+ start:469 stop:612 length:144 start_codon:yes stop_codon:yes gene_type:complete